MKAVIKAQNRKTLEIMLFEHISKGWRVYKPIKKTFLRRWWKVVLVK